jgi:DNA phosphorothioation-dependent restriction protein DptG
LASSEWFSPSPSGWACSDFTNYLKVNRGLKNDDIDSFKAIMSDIMLSDGIFNPIDSSFLKYMPLSDIKKYGSGQKKLAEYLASMLSDDIADTLCSIIDQISSNNIFCNLIEEALNASAVEKRGTEKSKYYILPFVKKQFNDDLAWFLKRGDVVVRKYIDYFLYFYACYSILQTTLKLDTSKNTDYSKPEGLDFILDDESASGKRDVVTKGWVTKLSNEYISKLYGRMQAVDMLNTLLDANVESPIGLYPQLLEEFKKNPFDAKVKAECEDIISYCYKGQRIKLRKRNSGKKLDSLPTMDDFTVNSYEEFMKKLEKICLLYQSFEYKRMTEGLVHLMKINFLQIRRGHGHAVLVLYVEMLEFLIALLTREEPCMLKDLYKKFEIYGIRFDLHTKQAIEEKLLKLNILERRSDSGEAQYVRIVL